MQSYAISFAKIQFFSVTTAAVAKLKDAPTSTSFPLIYIFTLNYPPDTHTDTEREEKNEAKIFQFRFFFCFTCALFSLFSNRKNQNDMAVRLFVLFFFAVYKKRIFLRVAGVSFQSMLINCGRNKSRKIFNFLNILFRFSP